MDVGLVSVRLHEEDGLSVGSGWSNELEIKWSESIVAASTSTVRGVGLGMRGIQYSAREMVERHGIC